MISVQGRVMKVSVDLVQRFHHLFHVAARRLQQLLLLVVQLQLDHFLNAVLAQYHWHAQVHAVDAVLAFQLHANREHAALVTYNGLYHLGSRRTRRIPGRSTHQFHQFAAAVLGAVHNGV